MEQLKKRMIELGRVASNEVVRLDTILNHQIDPVLTMEMGREFARRFADQKVSKVLTIESSGIPIAFATAYVMNVPMVFARRKKTLMTDENSYCERVPSFTKGIVTDIVVAKDLLSPDDRVLLIDDIIANGDAIKGALRILEQAGCHIVGLGVAVEKTFQPGAESVRNAGIRVDSLVRVAGLDGGTIQFE